jgi:hypothetical protein
MHTNVITALRPSRPAAVPNFRHAQLVLEAAFPRNVSVPAVPAVPAASSPHVAVLGGGVVGLTSAVQLLQRAPGVQVTLMADLVAANTTSEGAGGLWKPYTLGKWGGGRWPNHMGGSHSLGVCLLPMHACT